MISSIGAQAWSAADLTGNSALVTVGSTRYVAGGGYLHASTDYGLTWAPLVALPASTDPTLAVDSEGNVHILMAVATVGSDALFDVVKYVYNTTTRVLSAPLTLVHGTRTVSAYDLCSLTAGRVLAVATALEPVGHTGYYCLMAFEVEPDGAFSTVVLQQNHWATGDTFGSITLAGDGELYYTSHSRVFPLRKQTSWCCGRFAAQSTPGDPQSRLGPTPLATPTTSSLSSPWRVDNGSWSRRIIAGRGLVGSTRTSSMV